MTPICLKRVLCTPVRAPVFRIPFIAFIDIEPALGRKGMRLCLLTCALWLVFLVLHGFVHAELLKRLHLNLDAAYDLLEPKAKIWFTASGVLMTTNPKLPGRVLTEQLGGALTLECATSTFRTSPYRM
eukprot:CAMPEP_0177526264 /NCGR_PEP_ID=MMETSP0369-20130122/50996_1 /TAXON_ID=447022 ORGANISM="Scrippsiella hangoei-like, Strain SHHI-4" /NCGR_SAMPLE_ID=MMETSP0369 /ASSEMBLY_ACC=CAM_ASM_000364 /LENGTH=127 /DNA_ID=CAMNT_0019006487 /DNA_START=898 /DNA_END=1282 /DNA_ORIENTATION=+